MRLTDLKVDDIVEVRLGLSDWSLIEVKGVSVDHISIKKNIDDFWCSPTNMHKRHFKELRNISFN